jgi:sugar/nucleoside kinase (ribokinase family)
MLKEFDLICLGGASADLILRVPRLPASDEKLVAQFAGIQAGGLVANAACAAARLGLSTAWVGPLGDDEYGRFLLNAFEDFQVEVTSVNFRSTSSTDFTVILVEPGGERTILVVPAGIGYPLVDVALRTKLQTTKVVYTIPYQLEWFTEIARLVHFHGGIVAVDIESSSPVSGQDLEAIVGQCDLVFCDRSGLQFATGKPDLETGAQLLIEWGAQLVCVTAGAQGAWAMRQAEVQFAPAFPVKAVDTTGAGDCFHAAYLFAYLQGMLPDQALPFANAAAALSVQSIGARGGFPTLDQVYAFITASAWKAEL